MSRFDQLSKYKLISSPETVNSDWASPSHTLDLITGPFSLFFKYANGVSVNMKVFIQVSTNNADWANITESEVTITDNSGSVAYDIDGSGMQFVRIALQVTSGSIDVTAVDFSGGNLH